MNALELTQDAEEKRLEDFKKVAEHWDSIPEYARGKLDGTVSTLAALYLNEDEHNKKAG